MIQDETVLNLLPEHFRSADAAAMAVARSIDLDSATLLSGFIVFDTGSNNYRISRPVSDAQAQEIKFNQKGLLSADPALKFRGSYCTSDKEGASKMVYETGEQALYSNFYAPTYLARMISQDLIVRGSAGYWLAPNKAVLKFRSHADDEAEQLVSQAPNILNKLIAGTGSLVTYIQRVAQAGDLQVIQKSEFPGIWTTLGLVPIDWLPPVQPN
ncbi:hypothetical protein SB766_18445 [Pseudomonas sp. SIMBA_077]